MHKKIFGVVFDHHGDSGIEEACVAIKVYLPKKMKM